MGGHLLRHHLLLPLIISLFLLSYSKKAFADPGAYSSSGRTSGSRVEWQALTKGNFSSQIRLHPQILLVVTVPWSGEARTLMKEVSYLVANDEKLKFLKLMVINKNSEKMLAEILGAIDEITIYYYHNSVSHKYHGRSSAQSLLFSVRFFLSLKPDEVPLKPLQTPEDLENFFKSTDKAVLLLDFCGWSAKLMAKKHNENSGTPMASFNYSENVDIPTPSISSDPLGGFDVEQRKGNEDRLTCGVEDGLGSLDWFNEYTLANHSAPEQLENGGSNMSCTTEEFKRFESFFNQFTSIAREYFLPPEKQRFGLISEISLLPFLNLTSPDKWLVVLHVSGCSNCTMIVPEGDDLRKILQTHQSIAMEFDDDLEPAFPANRPSIILFIDRYSESLKVREESKLSLEVLRKFASQNQLSYQTDGQKNKRNIGGSLEEAFSRTWDRNVPISSGHLTRKASPKIVKIQDNMAIMIVNEGKEISLQNTALENHNNPVYDILTQLLQKENPALRVKETKISEVAKKAGFELLSGDFEVQTVESPIPHNGDDQFSEVIMTSITLLNDPQEPTDSHHDANSGLLSDKENRIENEGKQSVYSDVDILEPDEVTLGGREHAKPLIESIKEVPDKCDSKETLVCKGDQIYEQETGLTYNDENLVCLEQDMPKSEGYLQQEETNKTDPAPTTPTSNHLETDFVPSSSVLSAGNDIEITETSITLQKLNELGYQHHPFLGSFFFADGNYQLLRTLTTGSRIPTLVILDPLQQEHYVLPEEIDISYPSVVDFLQKYLDKNLTPYQHLESSPKISREMPKPPFVKSDFHEVDFIPQVTGSTFCDLVMGFKPCEISSNLPFPSSKDVKPAWMVDVLVLFSNSWCGFCQRMELIVREVHRAFKNFMDFSLIQSTSGDPMQIKDKKEDYLLHKFPKVLLMDCTFSDCGLFLKPLGKKENYPVALLFPAENKSAVTYEGDISVVSIMEFILSHGSNSQHLNMHRGLLRTHSRKVTRDEEISYPTSLTIDEQAHSASEKCNELILNEATTADSRHPLELDSPVTFLDQHKHVLVGSILTATDKLLNAAPFDHSRVLIVTVDQNQGFQGLIINKRISWDVFKDISSDLISLKQAPLFYGGPVALQNLPLVSLVRKPKVGYIKITKSVYFGNPSVTRQAMGELTSMKESIDDYWFFLGFSSWGYDQLFNELAEGAWHSSSQPVEHLDWPEV
ncbi:uncharacterized protein LOC121969972 [Zingiber officinale]|uniref:uncharacterized protein LOC121969972 n=1 Tax=Zingiber officinale TaxID=94328 RepID=UPI001C4BCC0D|nr:uncharacterized protein LOC121969972 [Zingiber officinale]